MKTQTVILALLTASLAGAQSSPPAPQSRVAGRFVAYNYGLWFTNPTSIQPGTGSQTFTVNLQFVTLPDGRQIVPWNTNSPIYVGTEKVTPSAVANCSIGDTRPGICSITATFAVSHTVVDTVSPATFGLQEALNDAGASGGGAVTIDSAWALLGGTTVIKNAATLPANTGIEDMRTGVPAGAGITALTGDVTATGPGSAAASVVKVNGAAVPASQGCVGTDGSSRIIAGSCSGAPTQPAAATFFGDSITNIASPTGITAAQSYVTLVSTAFGVKTGGITDYASSGSNTCDNSGPIVIANDSPTTTLPQPFRSILIGTNDGNSAAGQTPANYGNTFSACDQAIMAWEAVPLSSKILGSAATTSGTCANDTSFAAATGKQCTANASTITFSGLVTTGGPIYIWARYINGDTGTWTYAVDGGATTSVTTALAQPFVGVHSTTTSSGLIRITGVGSGTHSVVLTQTANGTMAVTAVGTTPPTPGTYPNSIFASSLPYLVVGQIPNEANGANGSNVSGFQALRLANFNLLGPGGDGLNLLWSPTDTLMPATTAQGDMFDSIHPNSKGHLELSQSTVQNIRTAFQQQAASSAAATATWCNAGTTGATVLSYCGVTLSGGQTAMTIPAPGTLTVNGFYTIINNNGSSIALTVTGNNLGVPALIPNGAVVTWQDTSNGYHMVISEYGFGAPATTSCPNLNTGSPTLTASCFFGTITTAPTAIALPTPSTLSIGATYTLVNTTTSLVPITTTGSYLNVPANIPPLSSLSFFYNGISAVNLNVGGLNTPAALFANLGASGTPTLGATQYFAYSSGITGLTYPASASMTANAVYTLVNNAATAIPLTFTGGGTLVPSSLPAHGILQVEATAANGWFLVNKTGFAQTGTATLSSGTVTVSNIVACAASSTCTYKFTNCGVNASTAIGTLSLGTVSAGTSFVINSLSATNTVATGDLSTVCWQVN